jgi:predicted ester cyclase
VVRRHIPDRPQRRTILAAYGGVFVAGSLAWGIVFDGFRPDRYDITGAVDLPGRRRRDHVFPPMTTPQQSKTLVRRLVEIVNNRDLDALEEVASGQIAEAARRWIGPFRDSFPDFRMYVHDVIAEGDKVVGHFKCSGTHQGEWRGIPPSGRRFEKVDEIYIFRVEDGKLSSATAVVEDNLTRMRQLGIQP